MWETYLVPAVLSVTAAAGGWLGGRFFTRRDDLEKQQIAAYRAVDAAIAELRSASNRLWDLYEPQGSLPPGVFQRVSDAERKAYDLVELSRLDTGFEYADAARAVVNYYQELTSALDHGIDDHVVKGMTIIERTAALYAAIPARLRRRAAPGIVQSMEAHKRKPKRKLLTSGEPVAGLLPPHED